MNVEFLKKVVAIQSELKAPKNQYNAFGKYKYRSCEDILEAVKPLACSLGVVLTITDEVKIAGEYTYIEAEARLSDGENTVSVKAQAGVESRKGMDIAQAFGASSSYARKYALNGLFLIDDTKDADATNDHGKNSATVSTPIAIRPEAGVNVQAAKDEVREIKTSIPSVITNEFGDDIGVAPTPSAGGSGRPLQINKVPDDQKFWLDPIKTQEAYAGCVAHMKAGGSVNELRNMYKISTKIAAQLEAAR